MTNTTHDILIIGDINFDYLGKVPRFPGPDEEVEVFGLKGYLGGSGANAAVVASRLGLAVAFYSSAGADTSGRELVELLAAEGLPTGFINQIPNQSTGMVFGAVAEDGERRLFSFRGANLNLFPEDIPDSALRSTRRLHLNGPVFSLALDLFERSRRFKIPNSIDPGAILIDEHGEEMDSLLALTDVLFVNQVEFAILGHGNSPQEKAAGLHRRGVKWVVVKNGADGSALYRLGEPELSVPAYQIQAVDTTGAGDAYNAGFLYAILQGYPAEDILRFANAVGALAAMDFGATTGVPRSAQAVFEFMKHTSIGAYS